MRARDLPITLDGRPGRWNAITDVPGVEVGYVTLTESGARTGVTAILPRGRAAVGVPCAAASHSFNGNGEMTGTTWIEEIGALTLPVMITNTHAVGTVHRGVVDWVADRHPALAAQWLLPVVAETWDGYLNDINAPHVRLEHAAQAIEAAATGPVAEGNVGGGTGMNCYAYKGGSGTASRLVEHGSDTYTVGVFAQANFGSRHELTIAGHRVGHRLLDDNPMETTNWFAPSGAGSVIVVVATDAPLLPGQCKSLARRVPMGLARTGTTGSHFSGDIFLAFSTANEGALTSGFTVADDYQSLRFVPWGRMDPYYTAVVQAVEEAVLNALMGAEEMTGRNGHRSPALPVATLIELLEQDGAGAGSR
ncbi:P1 family peptidase [Nonomuraea africana]|uniref:L-aminopeptidase/D-esterase-like protein n=1 Tax=Nonomuraea africana TaxID=46171 RepID=A0ABR9KEI4_9ACTN|nr:P1 family peptidase [Nonomuraea africana]MBE1560407.1 L-aminopeptidase/D-esterase-like protein [Nonomuraea africana]